MSTREKVLLVVLAFAVAGAAFVLLFFIPTREEISSMHSTVAGLESELADAREATPLHREYQVALDALLMAIEALGEIAEPELLELPRYFDEAAALNLMQDIMYGYVERFTIAMSPPTQTAPDSGLYVFRFDLAFDASYGDTISILQGFMDNYEDFKHRIVSFSIAADHVTVFAFVPVEPDPDEENEEVQVVAVVDYVYVQFSVSMSVEFLVRPFVAMELDEGEETEE